MPLTLQSAAALLDEHHLLREIIHGDVWTMDADAIEGANAPFDAITYDTRQVEPGTLLCCKGRFKGEYLTDVDAHGLATYVAETDFSQYTTAPGLIVDDVRKAMSLLSAAFYGRPQDELTVIGITGTKGKTTTAYFTHALLNAYSHGKAALFSSVDNCLDGHTYTESDLTTPESMDAFRMMRTASDNGMRYLVMEVSSQAYKVNRVYGLTFDVAAFLNVSPDHISPIEHPTFEDYLHCKRQIVNNAKSLVLGADCSYADLIMQDARRCGIPVTMFALDTAHDDACAGTASDDAAAIADAAIAHRVITRPLDNAHTTFAIDCDDRNVGQISLSIDGDFNYANAAAAIAIAKAAGIAIEDSDALHAMESVRIAGRMEHFQDPQSDTVAIVDYAHNYLSTTALLDYVEQRYGDRDPRITLVTGSAGNKAVDRRKEIVDAAQHRIERLILTYEDTDTEPVEQICCDMLGYVVNPTLDASIILDRTQAIETAVQEARDDAERLDVVLVIGKGDERWVKALNKHVPYEGDDRVIARVFGM